MLNIGAIEKVISLPLIVVTLIAQIGIEIGIPRHHCSSAFGRGKVSLRMREKERTYILSIINYY